MRIFFMKLNFIKPYINETALAFLLGGTDDRRYSWVKRSLKEKKLFRLKRGNYLVAEEGKLPVVDTFEIAPQLYGPSYISFESALSYHGWIPEAVYLVTSACTKRSNLTRTPIGSFSYEHTPLDQFFIGVEQRITPDSTTLIAHPWKALADMVYARHRKWVNLSSIIEDLRLDETMIEKNNKVVLKEIAQYYDSPRVRRFAQTVLEDLKPWI